MKLQYTYPYDWGSVETVEITCNRCDKEIDVKDGIYHCSYDEEDYHKWCVDQNVTLPKMSVAIPKFTLIGCLGPLDGLSDGGSSPSDNTETDF